MIRPATFNDIPIILSWSHKFVQEIPHPIEADEPSIEDTLSQLIESDDGCLIVSRDGQSAIGGMIFPYHFNKAHLAAQELFWWVDEKDRKNGLGKKLLKGFSDWAAEKGATTLHMIALSNASHDHVENLYKKHGFDRLETTYVKLL